MKPTGTEGVYGHYYSVRAQVRKAIARHAHRLTRRQLEVVELYYYEDRSMTQIAKQLNISQPAVSCCLARARRSLFAACVKRGKP